MKTIYEWLRQISWPLSLPLVTKLAIGRINELDMIHILVEIEQHDQCKGWKLNG